MKMTTIRHQVNHMTVPYSQISLFAESQGDNDRTLNLIIPKNMGTRLWFLYSIHYVNLKLSVKIIPDS